MDDTFYRILKKHTNRYPAMKPQDYGKLIFQSEFGPEHMIEDKKRALSYLKEELSELPSNSTLESAEPIGNTLCRFPLSACPKEDDAAVLLTDLFALTAQKHHGTVDGITDKLKMLEAFQIPGMHAWAESWKEKGYPPVHHSSAYREAYRPHYRILRTDYAVCFFALFRISKLIKKGVPVIVGIDGRCGSGKTHLAELIDRLFSCSIIHMDDFYLPPAKRPLNWNSLPGGNIDFRRFQSEIAIPLKQRETLKYRPYHCEKGEITGEYQISPGLLTIVEGSYSHHPSIPLKYDLKIFLTCNKEEKERRLKEREGNYFHMFLERWIPMEENYFACMKTEENSDIRINTSLPVR